jgi:hypothetical protein
MLGLVVHAVEHAVLEGDEVARRMLEVALAGLEQFGNRVLAVQRHEVVAQRIVGRVQRNGHGHRAVGAQAVDHRHHAGGRHRDTAARQPVGVVVEHGAQRGHQRE